MTGLICTIHHIVPVLETTATVAYKRLPRDRIAPLPMAIIIYKPQEQKKTYLE